MNIEVNDNRVQQNDNRSLNDDELCLVQGGANLFDDFAKLLFKAVNDALRGNGRPQV